MLKRLAAIAAVAVGIIALAAPADAATRPQDSTVTVTQSLTFIAAEPSYLYAHVTTTGLPGLVTLSDNIYCEGVLQESDGFYPFNDTPATPAEYELYPAYNYGAGCTVEVEAVTVGEDMGAVRLFITTSP